LALALSLGLLGWACGGSPPLEPETPQARPAGPEGPAIPPGSVDRGLFEAILLEGPQWALERIPIEEVMDQGKFKGWRIVDLPIEWAGIDLRPGDVVTAINGVTLEKPEDLFAAWVAMSSGKEIRVSGSREGEARELVIPIYGDADPAVAAKLSAQGIAPDGGAAAMASSAEPAAADAGASPAPTEPTPPPTGGKPGRKETIVIKPPERLESESTEW
jgi:hypothetical protein